MSRGRLTVFLGYAAGVGKTYQMLTQAHHLRDAGRDVVIAWFEPHARPETIALTEGLEFVPRRTFAWRNTSLEDMDTEAVIARRPAVAVVDEFAHTNAPGAPRPKRWQDVQSLLDAGIDVLTSLNIQHLESLNDQVCHVTGVRVRETVPDWTLTEASEIVMVDITPRALLHRLERGVVYPKEKAARAMQNFFTEANLGALRELALRQTALHVEDAGQAAFSPRVTPSEPARLLLWLTHRPSSAMLIRRGRRVADFLNCPCTALLCEPNPHANAGEHLEFCRNLRIDTDTVLSADPAVAVISFARAVAATHIFVARDNPAVWRLVSNAREFQVIIVAERTATAA
jgi:two-component system sensor histidine kinase KdpD